MSSLSSVDNELPNGGSTGTMECLLSDVVLEILSRLPVESVLDCKLVCRRWLNLLTHRRDQFAKMHHQHQIAASNGQVFSSATGLLFSFQLSEKDKTIGLRVYYGDKYNDDMNIHDKLSYKTLQQTSIVFPRMRICDVIVGSSNGLICLIKYHHGIPDPIHICNPITGEYVNLPEYTLSSEHYGAAYGFGYVHSVTNDLYKVVRIYYPNSEDYDYGEVQVYTIGSGSGWRTVGTTTYQLFTPNPLGIFVNGSLHWIDDHKIVAFNLADEEFRSIQPIPCQDSSHNCYYRLQSFRGNLCFCHQSDEEHLLDIWSLNKNVAAASWTKDFSIAYDSTWEMEMDYPVRPLLITKKNEVLFVHQGSTLYCYDPKTNTVIKLWDDNEKSDLMRLAAVPHMNSFVSLKALGEKCKSTKKKVRETSIENAE